MDIEYVSTNEVNFSQILLLGILQEQPCDPIDRTEAKNRSIKETGKANNLTYGFQQLKPRQIVLVFGRAYKEQSCHQLLTAIAYSMQRRHEGFF